MVYVGIDPSYTKTGLCIVDTYKKEIIFNAISPGGKNNHYIDSVNRSALIALQIIRDTNIYDSIKMVIEEPLRSSMKASGLGVLSGILLWSTAMMPNITNIYSIAPYYVSWLSRYFAKKYDLNKKKASSLLASNVIDYYCNKLNYNVTIKNNKYKKDGTQKSRILSHDEAEAFLLTLALIRHESVTDKELESFLLNLNPNFKKEIEITQIKK